MNPSTIVASTLPHVSALQAKNLLVESYITRSEAPNFFTRLQLADGAKTSDAVQQSQIITLALQEYIQTPGMEQPRVDRAVHALQRVEEATTVLCNDSARDFYVKHKREIDEALKKIAIEPGEFSFTNVHDVQKVLSALQQQHELFSKFSDNLGIEVFRNAALQSRERVLVGLEVYSQSANSDDLFRVFAMSRESFSGSVVEDHARKLNSLLSGGVFRGEDSEIDERAARTAAWFATGARILLDPMERHRHMLSLLAASENARIANLLSTEAARQPQVAEVTDHEPAVSIKESLLVRAVKGVARWFGGGNEPDFSNYDSIDRYARGMLFGVRLPFLCGVMGAVTTAALYGAGTAAGTFFIWPAVICGGLVAASSFCIAFPTLAGLASGRVQLLMDQRISSPIRLANEGFDDPGPIVAALADVRNFAIELFCGRDKELAKQVGDEIDAVTINFEKISNVKLVDVKRAFEELPESLRNGILGMFTNRAVVWGEVAAEVEKVESDPNRKSQKDLRLKQALAAVDGDVEAKRRLDKFLVLDREYSGWYENIKTSAKTKFGEILARLQPVVPKVMGFEPFGWVKIFDPMFGGRDDSSSLAPWRRSVPELGIRLAIQRIAMGVLKLKTFDNMYGASDGNAQANMRRTVIAELQGVKLQGYDLAGGVTIPPLRDQLLGFSFWYLRILGAGNSDSKES